MLSTTFPHANARQPLSTSQVGALTARDLELYEAIVEYKRAHDGCAPGHRELMALAGMSSTSVVAHHLAHLVRAGLITGGGRKQGIQVRGGRWTLDN